MRSRHLGVAKWIGTATGVAGAVLIALNIGAVAAGFVLFLISSLLWSAVGWVHREPSLVVLQSAFTAINLLGIYRWATF
jgi:nicotinamide riboside transporter PnuC